MPGKRNKDTSVVSRSSKSEETTTQPADNAQDIFRKYFEAQFQPLDLPSKSADDSDSNDDADEDDEDFEKDDDSNPENEDWDGVSDEDEDMPQVEVVEHKDAQLTGDEIMDKKARKAFMSGKLPSLDAPNKKPEQPPTKEEQQDDAVNLKHDLALQRLLRESHLLEDASDLDPTGKNRLKALDLRMQSLGAKTSLYSQQKMPSSHRKGIKAKAASKESKRRLEAKENGIILERPSKVTKSSSGKRDRGIGGSSIGKFSGGTLNLSKQDLHSMKSAPSRSGRGGRGGGRGGRGGRGGKRGRR
ncbi:hypothetical protein N7493_004565 [Penicillium malachiteum]|uniref:Protein FAF1 n=1 Tax=Penicillium malachiteum TaxID=1324776 RepID=A0AAD6MX49_9EURO|nr:hypothetical protein N7493_004565 [Penicillium malachiteum]